MRLILARINSKLVKCLGFTPDNIPIAIPFATLLCN